MCNESDKNAKNYKYDFVNVKSSKNTNLLSLMDTNKTEFKTKGIICSLDCSSFFTENPKDKLIREELNKFLTNKNILTKIQTESDLQSENLDMSDSIRSRKSIIISLVCLLILLLLLLPGLRNS